MNTLKYIFILLIITSSLSGCYVDNGHIQKGSIQGYDLYQNNSINISVLTPQNWETQVTTGGEYIMRPPNSSDIEFSISSSPVKQLMNKKTSESITLEIFKNFKVSQMNEKNYGSRLNFSINKSELSKQKAYEIFYTFFSSLPEETNKKIFVQETFTLLKGRVYRIEYYANKNTYSNYQKELKIIKDSYSILGN